MKKQLILALAFALVAFTGVFAQSSRAPMSVEEREQWLSEMRNYKHEFLAHELKLTDEQQAKFFPVYDQMDDALSKVSAETRALEQKVNDDSKASDIEIESAARALFEQKSREGQIETQYFEEFREILTPKQLLRLKNAERKFTQQLVRHHGKLKSETPRKKK